MSLPLPRVPAGGPVQVAYGVTDVAAAAARWEATGVGPFVVRRNIPVDDAVVAGRPGRFDHSSAFGWWGELMVELIEVHDPPSLAATGLHHVAFFVDSFLRASAELADRGWPPVLEARAGSTTFAFHDARAELAHLIEIYEPSDDLRRFYASIKELALR